MKNALYTVRSEHVTTPDSGVLFRMILVALSSQQMSITRERNKISSYYAGAALKVPITVVAQSKA
jgi:hypothetical protein